MISGKDKVMLKNILNGMTVIIMSGLLAVSLFACGKSSGKDSSVNVASETVSLGDKAKNVQLTAGVQKQYSFTYSFPGDITEKGDYSINVQSTLANVTLSAQPIAHNSGRFETFWMIASGLVKEAFAAETALVTVHISYAGDPNVCSSPYIGQDNIIGAIGQVLTGSKKKVKPSQEAQDIMNAGAFDICVVATPPFDAYVTLSGIDVDFEPCATPAGDIAGTWSGTYQCTNYGMQNDGGPVSLTITQNLDGSYSYIDDGGTAYHGHVCGGKFKFRGGKDGVYKESGTLLVSGGSATKTSEWQSLNSVMGGRCTDSLQKN